MKPILGILFVLSSLLTHAQVKFTIVNPKLNATNTLYVGTANSFRINAPQEVSITNITPSQGNVRLNNDGTFSWYVHEVSDTPVELKFTQMKNGVESELMYPTKYIVKKAPAPFQIKMGPYSKSGTISLEKLKKDFKITALEIASKTPVTDAVISCEILHMPKRGDVSEFHFDSSKNEESQKLLEFLIKSLNIGSKIYIEKVTLISKDGNSFELEDLVFVFEK